MGEPEPLPALLSRVLVAFTIEFDNEFELRLSKTWARPFLTSMVMWSNVMQFVRPAGATLGEVAADSALSIDSLRSLVGGLERWGYLTVDHDPSSGVPSPRKGFGTATGLKPETVLRQAISGEMAVSIWQHLEQEIETRWCRRLGGERVGELRRALEAIDRQIDVTIPPYLPVVSGRGLFVAPTVTLPPRAGDRGGGIPMMLSHLLLHFALEHEAAAPVSMTIGSNLLAACSGAPRRVGDLPLATGLSKEAVSTSMTWLENQGYIRVAADPGGRGKLVTVTDDGGQAQQTHARIVEDVEHAWNSRFGAGTTASLRSVLASILEEPGGADGPLAAGLVPPPGGWRAKGRYKALTAAFVENPAGALPRYPAVLHRGGWPDGS